MILENELALRWIPSGMSVMLTSDWNNVFAAKGSKNILNSAYLLEGTENTFPFVIATPAEKAFKFDVNDVFQIWWKGLSF